jgi:hypothetical protein
MPFEYAVSKRPPLAVVRGVGTVDLAMLQGILLQVVRDPEFVDGSSILIDLSDATYRAGSPDGVVLAEHWQSLAPRSRGAILAVADATLAVARQVEEITGSQVRAFFDADAALSWLRES